MGMHEAIFQFHINISICDCFVVTLIPKLYHAVYRTYSIEETKELSLSLYSDSMGVNAGKRPSLYSDKHGSVKVK